MRWPWTTARRTPAANHTARLVDGDQVLAPGQRRWADLLADQPPPLSGATQPLPLLTGPLLTRAGRWRSQGGRA